MKATQPCSVDQCERDAISRGLCASHYTRWNGSGRTGPVLPSQTEVRLAAEALGEWACRACGDIKPAADFGKNGKWTCLACQSQAQRERYARDGAAARQRSRLAGAKLRSVRVPLINSIKLERGCIDCGYRDHPAALHFDHRDPSTKLFTIAKQMTANYDRLMAEIAKCDVRCANCHAIRSVQEGHLGRPRIADEAESEESA